MHLAVALATSCYLLEIILSYLMLNEIFSVLHECNIYLFSHINAGNDLAGLPLAAARIAAVWLIFLIPATLVYLWVHGLQACRLAAIEALGATALALLINYIAGTFFYHARPFVAGVGNTYLEHAASSSFPSNHGTIMFAVALVLTVSNTVFVRRIGLLLLFPAIITAWGRVFVGVHWPLDMVGAMVLASTLAMLVRIAPVRTLSSMLVDKAEPLYRTLFSKLIARGWLAA